MSDATQPAIRTDNDSERIQVFCRAHACQQKLNLVCGTEGHVVCPKCNRRFWVTTRDQARFVRSIRTILKNQERLALAAIVLLILAAAWGVALWLYRDSFRFALHTAFAGCVLSWLLITWTLKQPKADNLLIGSLKEARRFFSIFSTALVIFLALHWWRMGAADPLESSATLLEIERWRDRIRNSYFAEFLAQPGWKLALAFIAFLALWLRVRPLMKAAGGAAKHVPTGARIFAYVMTALSAFTFGGYMHDGTLSRVDPVLAAEQEEISQAFARHVEQQLPSLLDEIANELVHLDDDDDVDAPAPPSSLANTHDTHSVAANKKPPEPTPGGDRKPGPQRPSPTDGKPGSRPDVADKWMKSARRDMEKVVESARGYSRGTDPYATMRETPPDSPFKAPSDADLKRAEAVRPHAAPAETAPATAGWKSELRSFVRANLGYAMRGKLPQVTSLAVSIDELHPYRAQLSAVAQQFVDGPAQGAIREILAEALTDTFRQSEVDVRAWVRRNLKDRLGKPVFERFRNALSNFRRTVSEVDTALRTLGTRRSVSLEAAVDTMSQEHKRLWNEASSRAPSQVDAKVSDTYDRLSKRIRNLPVRERAAIFTEQAEALAKVNAGYDHEERLNELERIEKQTLASESIKESRKQYAAEQLAERQRMARNQAQSPPGGGGGSGSGQNTDRPRRWPERTPKSEPCCKLCTYRNGILVGCGPPMCGPQCAGASARSAMPDLL